MNSNSNLACDTCPVRESAACASLNDEERIKLSKIGRHKILKKGETLAAAGDENTVCATLVSGALKITSNDRDGTERILSLVHPAGFVGELFSPAVHHDVVALTESKLCVFSRPQYEEIIEGHPALALALLRRSADDLFDARSMMGLAGKRSADARVAGLIQAFARAASHSPCHSADTFDLPLTRGEMAGMLGLTIETISRKLGLLESDGLIKRQGARGIRISDHARLAELSD